MATRILFRSFSTMIARSYTTLTPYQSSISSFSLLRLRPLVAFAANLRHPSLSAAPTVRGFSTRQTTSSLNDSSPNWSNRPPKETILLDGCDFEHWLVVVEPPESPDMTRDEIIDSYIKTLAQVVGSEEEARMKIYSVSTRCYYAFGALVSEELSYKIKELPRVRWVLPDSYLDVKNKDYGGEPFINGQAVPYDPKYHEEWIRNNARANERNRRGDRPKNFDRSRNFERRRENMQANRGGYQGGNIGGPGGMGGGAPPNMGAGAPPNMGAGAPPSMGAGAPPNNMGNAPPSNNYAGPPPSSNYRGPQPSNGSFSGPPPSNNYGSAPPPSNNYGSVPPPSNNYGSAPPPSNNYGSVAPPSNNYGSPPPSNNYGSPPPPNNYGSAPPNNFAAQQGGMGGPPNAGGVQPNNWRGHPNTGGAPPAPNMGGMPNNAPNYQQPGYTPNSGVGVGSYQQGPPPNQQYGGGNPYQSQDMPGRDMPPPHNNR